MLYFVLYLFEDMVNANAFCGICEFDPNPNRVYSAVKSLNFVLFFGGYFLWSRLCSSNSATQLWTSNKTIPKYKQESPRTQVAYDAFSRSLLFCCWNTTYVPLWVRESQFWIFTQPCPHWCQEARWNMEIISKLICPKNYSPTSDWHSQFSFPKAKTCAQRRKM